MVSARPVPQALRNAFEGSVEWVEGRPSQRAEIWTQRTVGRELRRRPGASFLGLGNSVPLFGPRGRHYCLIIYDLSFLVVPLLTDPSDLLKAFTVTVPSIWKAGRVIAISSTIESELLHYFPRLRGRTSALPLGGTHIASSGSEPFGRRRGFLVVGAHRRKNIGLLLKAFAALPSDVRLRHPLTIVARRLPERVKRAVERLGLVHEVRLAPDLTDGELGSLYSQSVALVYPSAYEGLGLPVAEAMLSGLPSIVPARSPMERFLGGAGIVVDPLEVESLAKAMHSLQGERALWERCVAEAGQAAAEVSWDRVADAAARAIGL
jgi:glycosyltransferase involved in cell wall biosynthesis